MKSQIHGFVNLDKIVFLKPFRYPYYNKYGEGKLIYGYGGQDLYRYSVFKPLDGYFKK